MYSDLKQYYNIEVNLITATYLFEKGLLNIVFRLKDIFITKDKNYWRYVKIIIV